jgi:hypothetical protein
MKAKKYLKGGQVKLDANKDGKISGKDFKMLRGRKEMKSGGKVVKYQEGGSNPTPTERTYTEDDRRQMTSSGNQPGADYKGYNKTKTPKEVLEGSEMRRLKSALRKNNYGTNGMSLADMRKAAKTKGIYDEARGLAREDYQKEMAKRR